MRTCILFIAACQIAFGAMACTPPYAVQSEGDSKGFPKKTKSEESTEDEDESDKDTDELEESTRDTTEDGDREADAVKYSASIPAAPSVPFGGPPYCAFNVTMKDVVVELGVNDDSIVSAKVTNTMVEGTEDGCPYAVTPPQSHVYSFPAGAKPVAVGETLTMSGKTSNLPKAVLTIDTKKSEAGYDVTLTWTRRDNQPANLLWTVTATLSLERN